LSRLTNLHEKGVPNHPRRAVLKEEKRLPDLFAREKEKVLEIKPLYKSEKRAGASSCPKSGELFPATLPVPARVPPPLARRGGERPLPVL